MFHVIKISIASLTLSLSLLSFGATHVIIDPGHGGHDKGAKRNQISESQLVLKVAKILKSRLSKDRRFKVSLTRHSDQFYSLSERTKKAQVLEGDVFVSIHANASTDRRAKGLEVYFQNQLPADEEHMFLAHIENQNRGNHKEIEWPLKPSSQMKSLKGDVLNIVQDLQRNHRIHLSSQLSKKIYSSWRGTRKSRLHSIKQAPFYVVSNIGMPSILVEIGFITNGSDLKKLKSKRYLNQVASDIHNGLIKFKEVLDKAQ